MDMGNDLDDRVTTARGLTLEVDDGDVPIEVGDGTTVVGDVRTDASPVQVPLDVTVPDDVPDGQYEVEVTARYRYTYEVIPEFNNHKDYRGIDRFDVTIVVDDGARFAILDTETDAQVGGSGDVTATLRNVGDEVARDAIVTGTTTGSGAVIGSDGSGETFVGNWEPGENRTVTFDSTISPDFGGGVRVRLDGRLPRPRRDRGDRAVLAGGRRPGTRAVVLGRERRGNPRSRLFGDRLRDAHERGPARCRRRGAGRGPAEPAGEPRGEPVRAPGHPGRRVGRVLLRRGRERQRRPRTAAVPVHDRIHERRLDDRGRRDAPDRGGAAPARVRPRRRQHDGAGRRDAPGLLRDHEPATGDALVDQRRAVRRQSAVRPNDEAFVDELEPGESTEIWFEVSAAPGASVETHPVELDFRYNDERGNDRISDVTQFPIDVTESTDDGGLPITALVVGLLVVVGVAGTVVWYRRR